MEDVAGLVDRLVEAEYPGIIPIATKSADIGEEPEPVLNLSWKAHAESSLRHLHEMYFTGSLCDVEIQVASRRVPCHRVVLAASSPYFRAMFTSKMQESTAPAVELHDVCDQCVKALIDFAYTGLIQITRSNVEDLMYASSMLQVQPVLEGCGGFLRRILDTSNCAVFLSLADSYGSDVLRRAAEQHFLEHFEDVSKTEDFMKLPLSIMCRLLSSDLLCVHREEDVFTVMMQWCQYSENVVDTSVTTRDNRRIELATTTTTTTRATATRALSLQDIHQAHTAAPQSPSYLPHSPWSLCNSAMTSPCEQTEHGGDGTRPSTRHDSLPQLLRALRWPLLEPSFLVDIVQSEELIMRSAKCRQLLTAAKDYHLMRAVGYPANMGCGVEMTYSCTTADWMTSRPRACYMPCIYAAGGRGGDRQVSALLPWKNMERYDFRKDAWKEVSSMCTARRHVALCTAGPGLLYAVGGHDGAEHLTSVEVYDPKKDKWSMLQPINVARRGHALVSAGPNGPLYVIGGINSSGALAAVERYNIAQNKWHTVAPMLQSRGGCGAAVLNNTLYVAGGNSGAASSTRSLEAYDMLNDSWRPRSAMSDYRAGFGMATVEGKIIVAGGFEEEYPLATVEVYQPRSDTWTTIAPLSVPRGGVSIVAYSGFVFAIGGHDGTNYLSSVEVLGDLPEQLPEMDEKCTDGEMITESELGSEWPLVVPAQATGSSGSSGVGGGGSILNCSWQWLHDMQYQRAGPGVACVGRDSAYAQHLFRPR
eukprot:scpid74631/ scgid9747/ Kelch-like protein 8